MASNPSNSSSCTSCGEPTAPYGSRVGPWPSQVTYECYSCFSRTLNGFPSMFEPMPPPMSSNPRDQRERSLAWNEEHCELALDPEDTMSTGQNRGERSDVQPSYVYSSHPDYVGDHEPVRSPIAPAPTATSQPGQSIISLLQNASRKVAEAKARRVAVADARRKAKEAKRSADSPCFVDECRFVAPRPAHREHLRSEHGIVHLRNKWLLQTAEQWTTVHPFQCPLKSCDVYWKGTPRKTGLQLHIQLSHWLEPQNKLPSGMWTCHLCLGLSPDFSKKFDLIKHLEQSHGPWILVYTAIQPHGRS